jgi:hypothetical protein
MRRIVALLLFVLALGLIPASARVGETLDQCKKRYGKAQSVPLPYDLGEQAKDLAYFAFDKNGIEIVIGFLNGKASDLSFHHVDEAKSAFTQVEMDLLLADNGAGQAWKTVPDGKLIFFPDTPAIFTRYGNYQQRDDGVMATVDGSTLHIFTTEWMAYLNTKMKARSDEETEKQKKNLEGF